MGHFGVVGYFVAQCIRVEEVKEGNRGERGAGRYIKVRREGWGQEKN